jgi:pilus assembly protein CpaF
MSRAIRRIGDAALRDPLHGVRRALHDRLLERVDVRVLEGLSRTDRRLRVREEALSVLRAQGHILPQRELTKVINEVSDEVVGFGPVEFLLQDPDVTEVTLAKCPLVRRVAARQLETIRD